MLEKLRKPRKVWGQSDPAIATGKRAKRRWQALCERQGWRCHWCGEPMFPVKAKGDGNPKDLTVTIDHVIPLAEGGRNILANTVAAHYRCNQARNSATQRGESVG